MRDHNHHPDQHRAGPRRFTDESPRAGLSFSRAAPLRARAFSLLELAVVLAVLAVLAAVAVPRLGFAQGRYRLDSAAARVIADVARAQQLARAKSLPLTISFDLPDSAYTIPGLPSLDNRAPNTTVHLDAEPYLVRLHAVAFGMATSVNVTGFGALASAGTVSLALGAQAVTIAFPAGDWARPTVSRSTITTITTPPTAQPIDPRPGTPPGLDVGGSITIGIGVGGGSGGGGGGLLGPN